MRTCVRVRTRVYEYLLRLRAPNSVCGVCEREDVHCGVPRTAESVWHSSICVSVVDDIAGDDATAGACDEATAGNDAGSHW